MNTSRNILLLVLVIGISGPAYGDLSADGSRTALPSGRLACAELGYARLAVHQAPAHADRSDLGRSNPVPVPAAGAPAVAVMADGLDIALDLEPRVVWPVPGAFAPAEGAREVFELPPPPSSSSLFLSAALSAGAWHLLRRVKDLNHAHLPDWYHPNAPHQIGHAVTFDPTLSFELLAVCVFDAPIGDKQLVIFLARSQPEARYESQFVLPVIAPRGPPAVS